jgi:hypothetical protein
MYGHGDTGRLQRRLIRRPMPVWRMAVTDRKSPFTAGLYSKRLYGNGGWNGDFRECRLNMELKTAPARIDARQRVFR